VDHVLDSLCRAAAEKARTGNQTVRFQYHADGRVVAPGFGDDRMVGSLSAVINSGWDTWVAYPSGLVQPLPRVNWFWAFPPDARGYPFRQGNAEQAWRYATGLGIPLEQVEAIPLHLHSGTCVLINGVIRHTLAFPAWAGV